MSRRGKHYYFVSGDFSFKAGGKVEKIWDKEEISVMVDGRPVVMKAGLSEQLRKAQDVQRRISEENRARVMASRVKR